MNTIDGSNTSTAKHILLEIIYVNRPFIGIGIGGGL